MKTLKLQVLLGSLALYACTAAAKVIETLDMDEALQTVDAETLLIFDLDNTVVMPSQYLGGEEWFDYRVEKLVKEKIAKGEAESSAVASSVEETLLDWNAVMRATKVVPVEKDGPAKIAAKQKAGTHAMALTARPAVLAKETEAQLKSIGIDFSKTMPLQEPFDIQSRKLARYTKGILYVDALNKKGEVLTVFLKRLPRLPKKVVFVDNKQKHVVDVEGALEAFPSIEYLGCRHGASDKKIAGFEPETADLQFKYFKEIMDDETARRLK